MREEERKLGREKGSAESSQARKGGGGAEGGGTSWDRGHLEREIEWK